MADDRDILADASLGDIISGGVQNVGNALTFGLMDEGSAAANAAIDYMLGNGWLYDEYLNKARKQRNQFRAAAGTPLAVAQDIIAGSLLPINISSQPARVSPILDSVGNAIIHPATGPSLAKLGAIGGLLGAAYGFGEGEGGASRAGGAAVGAGLGTAFGVGIPIAAKGVLAARTRLGELQTGPTGELGAVVSSTLSRGQYRNIRGPGAKEDLPIIDFVRQVDAETPGGLVIRPDWDTVANLDEAVAKYQRMKYIDPVIVDAQEARYSPLTIKASEGGDAGDLWALGNKKMAWWNPAYPGGRNTIDFPGCGRGQYCSINELPTMACYGGQCYADVGAKARGMEILQNVQGGFFKANDPRFQRVMADVRKMGLEGAQQKYIDEYRIAYHPDTQKVTVRNAGRTEGARVPLHIKESLQGQDLRLGVDSDASAFLSDPRVMDAILAANPKTVTAYSSAYHTPPPAHPLAGRTMINVTVSGWHPLPETLKRLEWAREARKNGWNVILRSVTADPKTFTPEVLARMARNAEMAAKKGKGSAKAPDLQQFNRLIDLFDNSDFYAMEQPLHMTNYYGKSQGLPACCAGGDCSNCLVSEGIGKEFRDFWGITEDQPLMTDYPNYLKEVDARTKAAKRFYNINPSYK